MSCENAPLKMRQRKWISFLLNFTARDCRFSSFDIGIITNQTPVNRGEKNLKKLIKLRKKKLKNQLNKKKQIKKLN